MKNTMDNGKHVPIRISIVQHTWFLFSMCIGLLATNDEKKNSKNLNRKHKIMQTRAHLPFGQTKQNTKKCVYAAKRIRVPQNVQGRP